GKKIIVCRIEEHFYRVGLGQRAVVKFDLHVDDVGNATLHQLFHVVVIPYATADRDLVGHPGHVHTSMLASGRLLFELPGRACTLVSQSSALIRGAPPEWDSRGRRGPLEYSRPPALQPSKCRRRSAPPGDRALPGRTALI